MSDEDTVTLQQIRKLADKCAKLEARHIQATIQKKAANEAWQEALAELTELCRSHETSEQVASRPMIKVIEAKSGWVEDTFAALLSVGYAQEQARAMTDAAIASGKEFDSVADAVEWCCQRPVETLDERLAAHRAVNDHFAAVEREADGEYIEPSWLTEAYPALLNAGYTDTISLEMTDVAIASGVAFASASDAIDWLARNYDRAEMRDDLADLARSLSGTDWKSQDDPIRVGGPQPGELEFPLSGGDLVTSRPGTWTGEISAEDEAPRPKRRKKVNI